MKPNLKPYAGPLCLSADLPAASASAGKESLMAMRDGHGRRIEYLRLSVTDRCNLRCRYCMPADGVEKQGHADMLSFEEIEGIARIAVDLGVTKIRLTGGEPLVRRGIVDLCRRLAGLKNRGLRELCMTTNGVRLSEMAADLKAAGLDRLNISLDTLDPEQYRALTRGGSLPVVLAGLSAAEAAGFTGTKINAVLIGGVTEDQIEPLCRLTLERDLAVRFIELMPMGETGSWPRSAFISCETVLRRLPQLVPCGTSGVADLYRLPGARGRVGLIRPMSRHFCPACDRLRVTVDGRLKPCLHSAEEFSLRGLSDPEIRRVLLDAVHQKPASHHLNTDAVSRTPRRMHEIGG